MILLALGACLDRMLEAPWVLTSGIGRANSVAFTPPDALLLATDRGLVRVAGDGTVTVVDDRPADAVTSHPRGAYVLRGDTVTWTGGRVVIPGATDLQAGWDTLYVLAAGTLWAVDPVTGAPVVRAAGLEGARALALGPEPDVLVVAPDRVVAVAPDGRVRTLVEGLTDARAAAMDAKGRVYVVADTDPALYRLDPGGPVLAARWLGDARDLHFGLGGLLATENVYLAVGTGSVEYLRPAP